MGLILTDLGFRVLKMGWAAAARGGNKGEGRAGGEGGGDCGDGGEIWGKEERKRRFGRSYSSFFLDGAPNSHHKPPQPATTTSTPAAAREIRDSLSCYITAFFLDSNRSGFEKIWFPRIRIDLYHRLTVQLNTLLDS
ncbi:hypothetical protein Drorol1_Dr00000302 [Drosera rotundifolia]